MNLLMFILIGILIGIALTSHCKVTVYILSGLESVSVDSSTVILCVFEAAKDSYTIKQGADQSLYSSVIITTY